MPFPAPSGYSVATNLNRNQGGKKPPATGFFRVSDDDMAADCHHYGDLFTVDRALNLVNGCLVMAALARGSGEKSAAAGRIVQAQTTGNGSL